MKGVGSEPMGIPMISCKDKLPKLQKKTISRRKLMPCFKETLSKVIFNLLLLSVHVASNFVTTINCFFLSLKQNFISSLINIFSLFCGIST